MSKAIITIDGPAGAGKSSLARMISSRLGYLYIDTGAMYRAVTWKVLQNRIDTKDHKSIVDLIKDTDIALEEKDGALRVFLDGKDVSKLIRSGKVSENTSFVAAVPGIRDIMVKIQRHAGRNGGVVIEGRDIGTVVFPKAEYKFYLDASIEERARRRWKELKEKGEDVDLKKIEEAIRIRDNRDKTRGLNPLVIPADAMVIDSTDKCLEEVTDIIIKKIGSKKTGNPGN